MLPELTFEAQLALCRELGVTHYCPRPRLIPDDARGKPFSPWGNHAFDLTPQRLVDEGPALRKQIQDTGLIPYCTVPAIHAGMTNDELVLHFRGAAAVGASRMRVSPPPYPDVPFDYPALLNQVIDRIGQVIALAAPFHIKIVFESHCRSLAASPALAYNLLRHFDPNHVGLIFDLPNFAIEGNLQPHLAVSVVQSWIDHCHVGGAQRITTGRDPRSFRTVGHRMCPLEESDLHIPTWLAALHAAGLNAPLIIENYDPDLSGEARLRQSIAALHRLTTV
jgi:sugar phosphate isomerase/epimerase